MENSILNIDNINENPIYNDIIKSGINSGFKLNKLENLDNDDNHTISLIENNKDDDKNNNNSKSATLIQGADLKFNKKKCIDNENIKMQVDRIKNYENHSSNLNGTIRRRNVKEIRRPFSTRNNSQCVDDFKKEYSRKTGNLDRIQSVVSSQPSFELFTPQYSTIIKSTIHSVSSNTHGKTQTNEYKKVMKHQLPIETPPIWQRQKYMEKEIWKLTAFGYEKVANSFNEQNNSILPLSTNNMIQCDTYNQLSFPRSAQNVRHHPKYKEDNNICKSKASVGFNIDLRNEKALELLEQKDRSIFTPQKNKSGYTIENKNMTHIMVPLLETERQEISDKNLKSNKLSFHNHTEINNTENNSIIMEKSIKNIEMLDKSFTHDNWNNISATWSKLYPFINKKNNNICLPHSSFLEVAPGTISLDVLKCSQIYVFPINIHNVGYRTDEFRIKSFQILCSDIHKPTFERICFVDRKNSNIHQRILLAPGLSCLLKLFISFNVTGNIHGSLDIVTHYGILSTKIEGNIV